MDIKEKLFFVDINDAKNQLLALELEFRNEDDGKMSCRFFDTNRGRGFNGAIVNQDDESTIFRTEQGDTMVFRVATVEGYDQQWRRFIEGSVPKFSTKEELHQWYYKQFLE